MQLIFLDFAYEMSQSPGPKALLTIRLCYFHNAFPSSTEIVNTLKDTFIHSEKKEKESMLAANAYSFLLQVFTNEWL